ncbi:tyrosine-protein phosphatase non-receptor type 13 [Eurytemora carolleeae]|uniref:tyrosine-protein phosphatase non-receptor type 13 n=1 Tax=Eurytemora carolleeae TaxID=1294199 RepID=UPI000C75D9BE|nr:tyrosine-protein phosphatase non-receptor type 13 [Eurytemora carolleeae]|eukprot:XP_023345090.1 tyrosine-protein phosphatase non-receptor type 13-like [Eurytemora affinis]
MSPPLPYTRSSTTPYQIPASFLGRDQGEDTTPPSPTSAHKLSICLIPEISQSQNTFEVSIKRNSLGLGFSITGGLDAPSPWTNLIRIKKIFPLQPAWETGQLKVGDVILKVSGVPLTSLSLRQALDILRTSPPNTVLQVCRIPDSISANQRSCPTYSKRTSVVRSYSYGPYNHNTWDTFKQATDQGFGYLKDYSSSRPSLTSAGDSMEIEISPATPEKEWSPGPEIIYDDDNDDTMQLLRPVENALLNNSRIVGEFSIQLTKVNGSLGFSLQSIDDTVLKHSIKGIVRDPALSDGRLKAGDKLLTANGVDLSTFTHQELIMFLRQCDETVTLGLFRDASRSQTPLDPESPTQDIRGRSPGRKNLRYEAKELVRSLQSSRTSLEKAGLGCQSGSYSHGTLGRRRGRPFSPAPGHIKGQAGRGQLLGSPVPTVESPVTPHNTSAPPSLAVTQAFNSLALEDSLEDRIHIEEVDSPLHEYLASRSDYLSSKDEDENFNRFSDYHQYFGDVEISSIPNSPSLGRVLDSSNINLSRSLPRSTRFESMYPASRPNELNLSTDKRRQGYIFHSTSLHSNQF